MKKYQKSSVTLVGAGPGHAELISLKGLKAIKEANVILYDSLASEEILEYAHEDTLLIYVGKSLGKYIYTQDQINELIVKYANAYGHVVRLKGGDPFVFGRGYEELEYVRRHGIECTIISGISSSVAVPASIGIPVTSRGYADSFWVLTGTTRDGQLSQDIHLATQSNATIIILMGMSRLADICQLFEQAGKGKLPAAVIQHGTRQNCQYTIASVDTLYDKAQANKLCNPAVIILGEVVSLHSEFEQIKEQAKALQLQSI